MSCIDALLLSFWPICRLIPWPPPQPMESHYLLPLPIPSFLLIIAIWSRRLLWLGLERASGGNGGQRKPRVWHKNFVPFADIFSLGVTAVACSTKMSKKYHSLRTDSFDPKDFHMDLDVQKEISPPVFELTSFCIITIWQTRDERKAMQVHWIRTFLLLDDVMPNKSTTTPFKVRTLSVCSGNWTCVCGLEKRREISIWMLPHSIPCSEMPFHHHRSQSPKWKREKEEKEFVAEKITLLNKPPYECKGHF